MSWMCKWTSRVIWRHVKNIFLLIIEVQTNIFMCELKEPNLQAAMWQSLVFIWLHLRPEVCFVAHSVSRTVVVLGCSHCEYTCEDILERLQLRKDLSSLPLIKKIPYTCTDAHRRGRAAVTALFFLSPSSFLSCMYFFPSSHLFPVELSIGYSCSFFLFLSVLCVCPSSHLFFFSVFAPLSLSWWQGSVEHILTVTHQ